MSERWDSCFDANLSTTQLTMDLSAALLVLFLDSRDDLLGREIPSRFTVGERNDPGVVFVIAIQRHGDAFVESGV